MFDNTAKQVIYDAELLASNAGDYVRLHHIAESLLIGQGTAATVLKSFGITKDNLPRSVQSQTQYFFTPWKTNNEDIYVSYYSPDVVSVWYHAQCLQTETGRSDATEFFLIGLMEDGGNYSETMRETFGFTMKCLYKRIQHLQAVSLWPGFAPEAHARRFFSLAQVAIVDSNIEEATRLVRLAINEMRQAKNNPDHRLLMARAQTVKQAARFYETLADQSQTSKQLRAGKRRAARYAQLAQALCAAALKREDDNWRANQLGFYY